MAVEKFLVTATAWQRAELRLTWRLWWKPVLVGRLWPSLPLPPLWCLKRFAKLNLRPSAGATAMEAARSTAAIILRGGGAGERAGAGAAVLAAVCMSADAAVVRGPLRERARLCERSESRSGCARAREEPCAARQSRNERLREKSASVAEAASAGARVRVRRKHRSIASAAMQVDGS